MSLTAAEVVRSTAKPVLEFTRGWMVSPLTADLGVELGLEGGALGAWVCGRAGVLGDVDADLAAAAIGFMHPARVRLLWESQPDSLTPTEISGRYIGCAYKWAPDALASLSETELRRLNQLTRTVLDAALPSTGALFTGWRRMPQPGDPACAVALSLHVLRELRGGAHLSAVQACGLGPVGSMLASEPPRGGPAWAAGMGWPEPYPEIDSAKRVEAERLTDVICEHAYEALEAGDRAEFVDLVVAARAALS